ncbi:mechanosensitive ion channel family protein [Lujinxingia vulgaris]|uniref:Mechanosensitive ion channel family protein n=1 Tax=Lujinxingia vulgaris TaxID=2600176 RepID=A0A5C6X790_9DELT|nr:mechanosensitive ion channel family protein [Lujinxingia vulgaris]TXD34971.1 mechanosensitive ion channel family protein [Lujinxingia vulgaris]
MMQGTRSMLSRAMRVGLASGALMCLSVGRAFAQDTGAEASGVESTATGHSPLPSYEAVIDDVMALNVLDIAIWRVGLACVVLMAGILMRTTLLDRLMRPLKKLAARTETDVDDRLLAAIRRPMGWLFNLVATYAAVLILQVPEALHQVTVLVLQTMGTVFVAWMIFNVVDAIGAYLEALARRTDSGIDDHLVPLLKRVMRLAVLVVMVITVIQQWGYDVTSLIAGLGLGGLAFALAAQSTLSNWFGSVMILTDRPFTIGDLVESEHGKGRVVEIGLRSTQIRTFDRTIITVPNADIATTAVANLSKEGVIAISTTLGMTYGTSKAVIERIIERIRELLGEDEGVDNTQFVVSFAGFGASSLDIYVHCFARATTWYQWHAIRERLFFAMMDIVNEEGGSFAFPSQSLYLETPVRVEGVPGPGMRENLENGTRAGAGAKPSA